MKIAQITPTFPPYWNGVSHVVYQYARHLFERGHDITVFTVRSKQQEKSLPIPFNVKYLPKLFQVGEAPLTPTLLIELKGFDLLHLHYPYIFGAELTLLASIIHKIPLVLTYHNRLEEIHKLKNLIFKFYNAVFEPISLGNADRILAVRKNHFVNYYPSKYDTRLMEIHNGVDMSLFHPMESEGIRKELGLPLNAPIVLFVGALDRAHRYKNVEGQLYAFSQLEIPEAHFLIVGDGDTSTYYKKLSVSLGLSSRVHFLGKIPAYMLPPIYNAADVLILPSTRTESFGMPLIEALACGTPVIASLLPGVKDAIVSGVDGFLVPLSDTDSLTKTLQITLTDHSRAKAMGRRGREKVIEFYDWNTIIQKLEKVYEDVVKN